MIDLLPPSLRDAPAGVLALRVMAELRRRQQLNKLELYKPYPKQIEFHNAGLRYRERLSRAGNQLGKTLSSAHEIAYHLTGKYPNWWGGKSWARPTTGWALGESMESTRDTLQRLLMGRPGEWGTGTIPHKLIIEVKRAQGIADSIDYVSVRHISGGISRLYFKSYEKGRSKLQGETLDFAAMDEEPPLDIYIEVLTRTNATKGIVWITFTPLLGMSEVVRLFLDEEEITDDRIDICMTIEDVDHYTPEEKKRIIASYPAHEREARARGIPILGSGRIFPVTEESIIVQPFELPDIWPRMCGIDFGIDHPTAAAWMAFDRDNKTTYVYDIERKRGVPDATPPHFAPLIKRRGDWIPVAWPHDGLQTEKGSGIPLAEQYRTQGVNMLHEMAQLPETGNEQGYKLSRTSVEAGISLILSDMQAGRFRVFAGLSGWFEEFRLYHRKDGKIVKLRDDLMAATRYGYVMQRYAAVPPDPHKNKLNPRRAHNWRV